MVFIHLKSSERNQFLFEIPCTTKCDDVLKNLVLSKISQLIIS